MAPVYLTALKCAATTTFLTKTSCLLSTRK